MLKVNMRTGETEQCSLLDLMEGGEDGVSAALFEADGNAWKNAAIRNIKAYFEREIPQELRDDVIILA